MRRIIVGAQVSMDGVMQAPGAPTEDPTKGFNPPLRIRHTSICENKSARFRIT